jgi:hypothetical protein
MTAWTALATYLTIAAAIVGLFSGTSRSVDGRTEASIGRWLSGWKAEPSGGNGWADGFLAWFDGVFRVRRVRLPVLGEVALPSLWRSIVVSFLSLLVLTIVWTLNKETLSRGFRFEGPGALPMGQVFTLGLVYGGATVITNWIPDYLSLVQSRWVMGKMARSESLPARVGWLGLDLIGTLTVAFVALYAGARLVLPLVAGELELEIGCFTPESFDLGDAWAIFIAGLTFETPPASLNYDAAGIYLYSTFLTSLWVWIYLVTGTAIRLVGLLPLGRPAARAVEAAPLHVLGMFAALAFSLTFWTTWAQGSPKPDVYIVHGQHGVQDAKDLELALEREGLSALTSADDTNRDRRAEAELVVFLDDGTPETFEYTLGPAFRQTELEVRCGHRPAGTSVVHKTGLPHQEVVSWAKRAPSLLAGDQITECRELHGLPPVPAACDALRP